jgi:hypothetical protein
MATKSTPLTASSTIGTWLQDPEGGPLIRKLLEKGGFGESTLAPVRDLPLQQLVALSRASCPRAWLMPRINLTGSFKHAADGTSDDAGGRSRRHRERQLGSRVAWQRLRPCILGLQARHRQADSAAFMYGPRHSGKRHRTRRRRDWHPDASNDLRVRPRTSRPFLNLIPPLATAEHLAASITLPLSDDAANINGATLPSDGGWSV